MRELLQQFRKYENIYAVNPVKTKIHYRFEQELVKLLQENIDNKQLLYPEEIVSSPALELSVTYILRLATLLNELQISTLFVIKFAIMLDFIEKKTYKNILAE